MLRLWQRSRKCLIERLCLALFFNSFLMRFEGIIACFGYVVKGFDLLRGMLKEREVLLEAGEAKDRRVS